MPPSFISARPRIRIDGEPRPAMGDAALEAVVDLPWTGQAHAELRLVNWGLGAGERLPGFQFQDLRLGAALELLMGEQCEAPVFSGEVTAMEERYGGGAPQLVVLAEDRLHRLARVRHNRSFENQSLSDVAQALAGEAELQCDAALPQVSGTWHQVNESSLAFLLRLLGPLDIAARVESGRLRLREEEPDREPETLSPQRNAERVRIVADLNHQPTAVTVRGYSPAAGEAVEASHDALSPAPRGATAADLLGELGWAGEQIWAQPFSASQGEADARAEGRFRALARRFLHGEILCTGIPGLRSGREVELADVSPRLQGRYRVVHCTHRFDGAGGYRTRVRVSRPDWDA